MSVLDTVMGQLDRPAIERIAGQLGTSPQQAQSAIQAALPVLLGALQRNAAQPEGAQALYGALRRDHQGIDLGGLLGSILGGGSAAGGGGGDLLGGVMDMLGGGQQSGAGRPADAGGGLLGGVMDMLGGGQQPAQSPTQGAGMGERILRHILGDRQQRAASGIGQAAGIDSATVMKLLPLLAPLIMAALGRLTQQRGVDAETLPTVLGGEMQRAGGGNPADRGFLGGILDADGDGDVDASDLLARGSQIFGAMRR